MPRLVGTGIVDEEGSSSGEHNKDAVPAGRVGTAALHAAGQKTCDNDDFRPCRLRCNFRRNLTIWKPERRRRVEREFLETERDVEQDRQVVHEGARTVNLCRLVLIEVPWESQYVQ